MRPGRYPVSQRLGTRQPRTSTRNEFLRDYQLRVRALDVAVILTAIVLGLLLGWGYGGQFFGDDRPRQFFSVALLVVWPIALWQTQSTKATIIANGLGEYRRVIVATMWTGLIVMSLAYLTNTTRGRWFLFGVLVSGLLLLLDRAQPDAALASPPDGRGPALAQGVSDRAAVAPGEVAGRPGQVAGTVRDRGLSGRSMTRGTPRRRSIRRWRARRTLCSSPPAATWTRSRPAHSAGRWRTRTCP